MITSRYSSVFKEGAGKHVVMTEAGFKDVPGLGTVYEYVVADCAPDDMSGPL